jgi:hypothetical protein
MDFILGSMLTLFGVFGFIIFAGILLSIFVLSV